MHVELEKGEQENISATPSEGLELVSTQGSNFTFKGPAGGHSVTFTHEGDSIQKNVKITDKWDFEKPKLSKSEGISSFIDKILSPSSQVIPKESSFKDITTVHTPVHPFGAFSIFGYMPGWVMTYVSFSILFNIALRKLMNLH